ncbi:MAG: MBL fold metallo-hydrolase [Terriglobia bacterium]|nr:MAG: MBL fold metallo-hydrolase [Terriglobia bacterium]
MPTQNLRAARRLLLSVWLPFSLAAQAPNAAPAKPDSAEVTAHVEKAKKIAGSEWAAEANFFCIAPRANSPNDPVIEPTKIFDNVYAIGRSGTVVYAITTSEGIILIDTGYANETESVLLPGMKKAGLDPAKVKLVVITHGHGDHFGGAPYFQDHYGAHVVLSQADWDLMLNPPPAQGKKGGAPVTPPKKDQVATEGQPITLGDEKITPVMIPGHTPGSMGLIFNVTDNGKRHVAGLYGGTVLTPNIISDAGLQQYLHSVEHFKEATKQAKVDVELQNHPLYDGLEEKLAKLRDRKPGAPNPFVVGQSNYGKFLDIMAECMRAQIARRAQ